MRRKVVCMPASSPCAAAFAVTKPASAAWIYSVVAALERAENDAIIFPYRKFMSQRKKKQQNIRIWTPKDQNNFVMDFLSYDPLI